MPQVRVPTNIVSSICDDRGEEPTYYGADMSNLMEAVPAPDLSHLLMSRLLIP